MYLVKMMVMMVMVMMVTEVMVTEVMVMEVMAMEVMVMVVTMPLLAVGALQDVGELRRVLGRHDHSVPLQRHAVVRHLAKGR